MTSSKPIEYQKHFVKLAIKRLPHHTLLYAATKGGNRVLVRLLGSYAKRKFVKDKASTQYGASQLQNYKQIAKYSVLWHGTGRYQHANGKIVDVLESILKHRSLRPVEDAYAIFSGGEIMTTTSLTPSRIIARSYADIHGLGYREPHRYGDALMWTSYHYGMFYARMYGLHYPMMKRHYKTWHDQTHDENGHNTWGKKANQSAQDVWDVFGLGSDIPGNYPILFGLKHITETVPLSKVFQDYEVRVNRSITLDDVTHLEVPHDKVDEIKQLLAKHEIKIPVQPIELAEYAASFEPFSQLLAMRR